MTPYS